MRQISLVSNFTAVCFPIQPLNGCFYLINLMSSKKIANLELNNTNISNLNKTILNLLPKKDFFSYKMAAHQKSRFK